MGQMVMETKIDYLSFINTICKMVKEMLGDEYQVQIHKVTKNNSLELDSLLVLQKGRDFAPNIYLQHYYESYQEGTSIQEIAERICIIYRNNTKPKLNEEFNYSLEKMKEFIVYRLISYEKNQKLLSQIPHVKYLDLAITFQCLVRDDDEGIGTIRITNEHMKLWRTSTEELITHAAKNTCRLLPASIRTMEDTIIGLLNDEMSYSNESGEWDGVYDQLITNSLFEDKPPMYILTNHKGINGASCILYDNLLNNFSNQVQSDFYILPSSVHEVILLPFHKNIDRESLKKLVKDVNYTQVAPEEVLSDQVYYYSREKDAIIL